MSGCEDCCTNILKDSNCCDPDSILKILEINDVLQDKKDLRIYKNNPIYNNLDVCLLPLELANIIVNRQTNNLIEKIQCDSKWINQVYTLYMALKLAGDQAGRGRTGCCYKVKWTTCSGKRTISFNQLINLNRYIIRNYKTSHLNYFINTTLTLYKKMEKAKEFISTSREYPFQYLINKNVNKFTYPDFNNPKKVHTGCIRPDQGCGCYNKMDYIRWLRSRRIITNNYSYDIGNCESC